MEIVAHLRSTPISPSKASKVADLVRGCEASNAVNLLSHSEHKAGSLILKLLNSALANAKQKKILDLDSLYIKTIFVNKARDLKRFRPSARGGSSTFRKRHSHISLTLGEK